MTHRFLSLPTQIFDLILSYEGLSQAAMHLWLSGDARMQNKIRGITLVDLQSTSDYALDSFCSFILELPKLRRLTLDRGSGRMIKSHALASQLKKLPPSLTQLSLRVQNSASFLTNDYAPNLSSIFESDGTPTIECVWSMETAFPQLHTLELRHSRNFDLLMLPSSLTSLTLRLYLNIDHVVEHFYRHLPRQLLHLDLQGLGTTKSFGHLVDLPPNLTTLTSDVSLTDAHQNFQDFYDTVRLPQTLTHLESEVLIVRTRDDLELLPASLTTLGPVFFEQFISYDEIGLHLPHLTSLDLKQMYAFTPSVIRKLPHSLISLYLRMNMEHIAAGDWPKGLKKLVLYGNCSNVRGSAMPSNLTSLKIEVVPISATDLSHLPRTLRLLTCFVTQNLDECDFPPNLTSLSLTDRSNTAVAWITMKRTHITYSYTDKERTLHPTTGLSGDQKTICIPFNPPPTRFVDGEKVARCFPYSRLPRTITELRTNAILPASQLKHLPPRLKALQVDMIFKDADYHPNSSAEIDAMHSILQIGKREGIQESFAFSTLKPSSTDIPSPTLSILLPRTIRELTVSKFFSPGRSEILHLPPNLTHLAINHPHDILKSDDFYDLLKLNALTFLKINIERLTDEHIKALPQKLQLTQFWIPPNATPLTDRAALYLPGVYLDGSQKRYRAIQHRLRGFLDREIRNEDDMVFRKLLNPSDHLDFCYDLIVKPLPQEAENNSN